jgi:hypothetical protein
MDSFGYLTYVSFCLHSLNLKIHLVRPADDLHVFLLLQAAPGTQCAVDAASPEDIALTEVFSCCYLTIHFRVT